MLKKTQRYNEEDAIAALTAIDGLERGELPWNAAWGKMNETRAAFAKSVKGVMEAANQPPRNLDALSITTLRRSGLIQRIKGALL